MKMTMVEANGLELRLGVGQGGGLPVLFVHGFSNDRHVWHDVASALPGGYRPLALDLRGHGESDWSLDGRYSPGDYALDLPRVLDAVDVDRAIVVGHSLGGNAATLFAAEWPDRVSALVLVDTGPSLSDEAWQWAAGDAAQAAQCFDDVAAYRRLLSLAYPFGQPDAIDRMARTGLIERIDGRFETRTDPLLYELVASEHEWADAQAALWAALGKLQCPTLVVRGERSAMLSQDVVRRMVHGVLQRGRSVTVPNAGHAVAVDNPAGLSAALAGFFEAEAL